MCPNCETMAQITTIPTAARKVAALPGACDVALAIFPNSPDELQAKLSASVPELGQDHDAFLWIER